MSTTTPPANSPPTIEQPGREALALYRTVYRARGMTGIGPAEALTRACALRPLRSGPLNETYKAPRLRRKRPV